MERISIENLPPVDSKNQKHLMRYVNFINSRPERELHQKGFHTHHIYPKSIAVKNNIENPDEDWNLIELTPREHFIAHLILWKCGYREMISAFWFMCNTSELKITSRQYEKLMKDHGTNQANTIWVYKDGVTIKIDKNNWINYKDGGFKKGRTTRTTHGLIPITNGVINKFILPCLLEDFIRDGYYRGQTRDTTKNKIRITDGNNNITIEHSEESNYLNLGWRKGIVLHDKEKRIRITNGIETKNVKEAELNGFLERGWRKGTSQAKNTGKTRISKGEINRFVDKEELVKFLQDGWIIGFYNGGGTTKNRKGINNGLTNKFVDENELQKYLTKGWKLGLKPSKK